MKRKIGEVTEYFEDRDAYAIDSSELDFDFITEEFLQVSDFEVSGRKLLEDKDEVCVNCEIELFFNQDTQVFYCPNCNEEYEQREFS